MRARVMRPHAYIRTTLDQLANDPKMAAVRRGVQGGHAIAPACVHVGASIQKQVNETQDDRLVIARVRHVGRRDRAAEWLDLKERVGGRRLNIRTAIAQQAGRIDAPPVARAMQRGRAGRITLANKAGMALQPVGKLASQPEFGGEEAVERAMREK